MCVYIYIYICVCVSMQRGGVDLSPDLQLLGLLGRVGGRHRTRRLRGF